MNGAAFFRRALFQSIRKRAALGLLLMVAGFTGLTCSSSADHTYVAIHVTIDETISATQLYLVTSCEAQVSDPTASALFNVPCPENNVPRDVGTFQWVSQAKSGNLQFTVSVFDANHVLIGSGTSDAIPVAPGKQPLMTTVVVSIAPRLVNDGGTDATATTSGTEAGTDSATTVDGAATDTQIDNAPSADASLDQAAGDVAAAIDQTAASDTVPTDAGTPDQAETSGATGVDGGTDAPTTDAGDAG